MLSEQHTVTCERRAEAYDDVADANAEVIDKTLDEDGGTAAVAPEKNKDGSDSESEEDKDPS